MIILRAFMGDGWRDLGIKPKFKKNIFLYLVSLIELGWTQQELAGKMGIHQLRAMSVICSRIE